MSSGPEGDPGLDPATARELAEFYARQRDLTKPKKRGAEVDASTSAAIVKWAKRRRARARSW